MAPVAGASIDIRKIEALHLRCLRPEMQFLLCWLLHESAARNEQRRMGKSWRDPGNIEVDEDAMTWMLALTKVSHPQTRRLCGEQRLQQRLRRRSDELPLRRWQCGEQMARRELGRWALGRRRSPRSSHCRTRLLRT
jgi:hypothetical protein